MEIIVEVGTEEQKEAIRSEIAMVYGSLDKHKLSTLLHQVIVPTDFEKTIRELSGDESYKAFRGQVAIAKNVNVSQGVSIVFSPWIYNEKYDLQIRVIWYIHELFHALNKNRFPPINTDSISRKTYLGNLYLLFDEYYANRKSFEIMEKVAKPKTLLLKRFINIVFSSHVKSLVENNYFTMISDHIIYFGFHGNVNLFLDQVNPCFDEASKDIVYAYSFLDHFPRLTRVEPLIKKSKMVNKKTMALIDFFRHKYQQDDFNLEDGIEIMENYMTNFGMRFKDTPEGVYCEVLNLA